jgi:hypothetical protein
VIAHATALHSAMLHPLSARFRDAALEAEFQREYVPERLQPFARKSLFLGALTYASYGLHDLLVLPAPVSAWVVRYGLVCPALLACWALTYTNAFTRLHQVVLLAYGVASTMGVFAIAARSPGGPYSLYAGFAALFVTIAPLIARFEVRTQAAYTAISVAGMWALFARTTTVSSSMKLGLLWTLLSTGSLGTLLAWLNERQEREGFLARRTIRAQKEEIERERALGDALAQRVA